jgi:hypothetical protein
MHALHACSKYAQFGRGVMFLFQFSQRTCVSLNKLLSLIIVNVNDLHLVIGRTFNSQYVVPLISVLYSNI